MIDSNHRNEPVTFSDIKMGQTVELNFDYDEQIHNSFAQLFKDFSPVHMDKDYCSKTIFGDKIGYAFVLTGYLSRLYGEYLPGGNSICLKQDTKFQKPFYIGDKLRLIAEVTNKFESIQVIEIRTKFYREAQECIFKGVGLVQITTLNIN